MLLFIFRQANDIGQKNREEIDAITGAKAPDQPAGKTFRRRQAAKEIRCNTTGRPCKQSGKKYQAGVTPSQLAAQAKAVLGKA